MLESGKEGGGEKSPLWPNDWFRWLVGSSDIYNLGRNYKRR